jgi:hypothetical protein
LVQNSQISFQARRRSYPPGELAAATSDARRDGIAPPQGFPLLMNG